MENWNFLCDKFMKQYEYNVAIEITRQDLQDTKQYPNETFSDFVIRWRKKASQMTQRPSEEEQTRMIVKNLAPTLNEILLPQYLPTFKASFDAVWCTSRRSSQY